MLCSVPMFAYKHLQTQTLTYGNNISKCLVRIAFAIDWVIFFRLVVVCFVCILTIFCRAISVWPAFGTQSTQYTYSPNRLCVKLTSLIRVSRLRATLPIYRVCVQLPTYYKQYIALLCSNEAKLSMQPHQRQSASDTCAFCFIGAKLLSHSCRPCI